MLRTSFSMSLKVSTQQVQASSQDGSPSTFSAEKILTSLVINVGDIVKSKYFALLEGTRALEVLNPVLDTGLIKSTTEELQFDVSESRSIETVLNIAVKLFQLVMSWLNNSSLRVTVLSCRFVEEALKNFDGVNLSTCNFGSSATPLTENEILVHKVLLSYVHALLLFIRNSIFLGQAGVLYEEEDITTSTMGFDFLNNIDDSLVKAELSTSVDWLNSKFDSDNSRRLISLLKIAEGLIEINSVLQIQIKLFNEQNCITLPFLRMLSTEISNIRTESDFFENLEDLPKGCMSRGIQRRNDNILPPSKQHISKFGPCIESASQMVEDLKSMIGLTSVRTMEELTSFLHAFMDKRHPSIHVIPRGLLQLFLIHDDRSVIGDPSKHLINLLVEDMCNITAFGSAALEELQSDKNTELKIPMMEMLSNIENAYYSLILAVSQNPCRQRQHFNRLILVWDTLQVQSEQLEVNLREKYSINDVFKIEGNPTELPTMPISSWVYYQKLRSMIEVCLRGVELEIYKNWELHSIFWYIEYLYEVLETHLNRIMANWVYKRAAIHNLSKKIKKQKAGEKKQQMKEVHKQKIANELPKIEELIRMTTDKLAEAKTRKKLAELQKLLFTAFEELKLVQKPKLSVVPESLSYGLKMKSFHSVGVPESPSFDDWSKIKANLASTVKTTDGMLKLLEAVNNEAVSLKKSLTAKSSLQAAMPNSSTNSVIEDLLKFISQDSKDAQAIRSAVGISLTATKVSKHLREEGEQFVKDCATEVYHISTEREGYDEAFPFFNVVKK